MLDIDRLRALLWKEFAELRRNPLAFVPVMVVALAAMVLPFIIVVAVPAVTGDHLADTPDFRELMQLAGRISDFDLRRLEPEAAVQAMLFEQFLLLFVLVPVAGSMSVAAHSIIGEKQARTLEPLLATPVTTVELLVAKVAGALWPSLAISLVVVGVYLAGIWLLALPGVFGAVVSARSAAVVLLLGPMAALLGLQLAVLVSARVNDPRGAQQIGALIILPVVGILVAQFSGLFWLTAPAIVVIVLALLAMWLLLVLVSVAVFERETILTRWK